MKERKKTRQKINVFFSTICRYDVMMSCWETNPDDRPTFPELKETLMKLEEVQSRVNDNQNKFHLFCCCSMWQINVKFCLLLFIFRITSTLRSVCIKTSEEIVLQEHYDEQEKERH